MPGASVTCYSSRKMARRNRPVAIAWPSIDNSSSPRWESKPPCSNAVRPPPFAIEACPIPKCAAKLAADFAGVGAAPILLKPIEEYSRNDGLGSRLFQDDDCRLRQAYGGPGGSRHALRAKGQSGV